MREVTVIGIDCATDDANVGAALGKYREGELVLQQVKLCGQESPNVLVAGWLGDAQGPVLLALDAPLGWPMGLARALVSHRAGEAPVVEPNQMFRRATDRFIQRSVGKTPLDVGADRIARTAHAALRLLRDLRKESRRPISLAWSPGFRKGVSVIEVYPAATLMVHGVRSTGYKKPGDKAARSEIIDALRTRIELPDDIGVLEQDANALDAVVCLLAAKDFLEGQSTPPENRQLAEQEGWIWSRKSSHGVLEVSNAAAEAEEVGVSVGRSEGEPRAEGTSRPGGRPALSTAVLTHALAAACCELIAECRRVPPAHWNESVFRFFLVRELLRALPDLDCRTEWHQVDLAFPDSDGVSLVELKFFAAHPRRDPGERKLHRKGCPSEKNFKEYTKVLEKLHRARAAKWAKSRGPVKEAYLVLAYLDPVNDLRPQYGAFYDPIVPGDRIQNVQSIIERAAIGTEWQFTCKLLGVELAPHERDGG